MPAVSEGCGEAALAGNDPVVTGELLLKLRQEMGLSRPDFGRLVGLSDRSVASWEGGADLRPSSLRTIIEVGRLHQRLRAAFPDATQLAAWLRTPNKAFEGSTPIQVVERGEIDRLWRMVYFLESGTPG